MNAKAKKFFDDFIKSFPKDKTDHKPFVQLVETYANMCAEEDDLQKFVNKNGVTYQYENRDGTTLHKHFPQHQMLSKLRTQKTATFRTLIKYVRDEEIKDDGEGLLR